MEHYYERNLVINNRELKYKGIFRANDLFSTVNRSLEKKGYQKREKKTEEVVTETGRKTYVELRPFKDKTAYARYVIKIKITLDNVTEVVEEVKGETKKFQKGDVSVIFDSWLLTDYAARWGMRPLLYLMKSVINKYLYTFPLEANFQGELAGDTAHIYGQIKKLLNSYKFESGKMVSEEEVRKEVEKEIGKK